MKNSPSNRQLKRDKISLYYEIVLPQGVRSFSKTNSEIFYTSYSNRIGSKTKKKALKLLEKYNGAFIEQMLLTKHYKTWCIGRIYRHNEINLSDDELWDKYSKYPEVILGKERI